MQFLQIPKDMSERVEEIRVVCGFFPCSLYALLQQGLRRES